MGGCQECAGHSRHSPVFSMSFNLNGAGTKMDQKFKMFQFWSTAAASTKSLRSIHLPGFFRMHSAQVLWVDNGITQRTSEELLWAWSPSVMFSCHVFVIIPRHVDPIGACQVPFAEPQERVPWPSFGKGNVLCRPAGLVLFLFQVCSCL